MKLLILQRYDLLINFFKRQWPVIFFINDCMIPLNKPFLPPKSEFDEYVSGIWSRNWLTNHGPLVERFEAEVSKYLDAGRMLFVTNGTTALQIAIRALDLKGEIITTPYSYVATTSSIVWQNCKPVFVDIDPESFNIDPSKIEEAVTDRTSGILATHIYGNPCDVEAIGDIAEKYNLKIIYDAAHCFGVTYKGKSIFEWGDISITSFHATKVFHTVEGGGLFSDDDSLFEKMSYMRNFGHNGLYQYKEVGINGKNNEFNAAMGLCNLKYADNCLEKRRYLAEYYDEKLKNMPLKKPRMHDYTFYNHAYYPVLFESVETRKKVVEHLKKLGIETRSYFRPDLSQLPYVDSMEVEVSVSKSVSERIVCLPFYFDLTHEEIDKTARAISSVLS